MIDQFFECPKLNSILSIIEMAFQRFLDLIRLVICIIFKFNFLLIYKMIISNFDNKSKINTQGLLINSNQTSVYKRNTL